jgi:tetratricopeptide (TPR) repeat protein
VTQSDPQLAKAAKALAENRLKEAYALVAPRLAANRDDVGSLRVMGMLAARMGRPMDAARMLGRSIALAQAEEPIWRALADALHQIPPADALAEVRRQRALRSDLPGYHGLEAAMLERAGQPDEAIALLRAFLTSHPTYAGPWVTLGNLYKTVDRMADAIDAYRRAIAMKPDWGEPWWALSDLKTFRFDDADVAAMQTLLARQGLREEDRIHLNFALGWAYEKAGDPTRSFAHYAAGNRLRRARIPHDRDLPGREREAARRLFAPDFLAVRTGWGCEAADPIFIVGMPRAGSTLVEQILASHPLIEATMELNELPALAQQIANLPPRDGRRGYPDIIAALSREEIAGLGQAYLDRTRIQRRQGKPHFIDKLPGNFRFVPLIRTILPHARIIDVRRNPMSCGFSLFRQYLASGQSFAFDLEDIGAYYADYARTMALWDEMLPGHVYHLAYESLIEDLESEVRALLDYLGLPFDPACLTFHETRRTVRTPSAGQVRQPLNRRGMEDWQPFEPWLGPLKAALGTEQGAGSESV